MHRREKRALRAEAEDIVAEAEATINGRLLDRHWWEDDVPGSVLVHTLAHADWRYLSDLRRRTATGRSRVWDSALLFLADEVLSVARSPEGVRDVQRRHLIPLELDMLAGICPVPATPADLVGMVGAELARARSRHRHPSFGPPDPADA